jgi:hypothetical protein
MVNINNERLIAQLKKDEGFSPKAFWDIKQWTFGYGCLAPGKGATITEPEAATKLIKRAEQSIAEFNQMFFGEQAKKFNDVRAEAFINMLFNMGMGSQAHPERGGLYSFKNTLSLIFDYLEPDWNKVARNLKESKWYSQVGARAVRICKELATGVKA